MYNSTDINKAPGGTVHMDDLLPRIAFDTKAWKQIKMRELFNHINANLVQSEWLTSNASGKDVSYLRPVDGIYSSNNVSIKGALKITLPDGDFDSMIKLHIEIFNLQENSSFSVFCSGYHNEKKWTYASTNLLGDNNTPNHTIRYGHDGANGCIYIGELNTLWSHPKVLIQGLLVGWYRAKITHWVQGWKFGFETEAFTYITRTHTNKLIKNQ